MLGINKGIWSRRAERSRTGKWWEASTGGEWTGLRRSQIKKRKRKKVDPVGGENSEV